jgi:hypothetical protein
MNFIARNNKILFDIYFFTLYVAPKKQIRFIQFRAGFEWLQNKNAWHQTSVNWQSKTLLGLKSEQSAKTWKRRMNKQAQVKVETSSDSSAVETALKPKSGKWKMLYAKKQTEAEIRVQLAEFARELSRARKEREK